MNGLIFGDWTIFDELVAHVLGGAEAVYGYAFTLEEFLSAFDWTSDNGSLYRLLVAEFARKIEESEAVL